MEKYTSENSELVAKAIGYIRENKCDPEITVGDVARGAGFFRELLQPCVRASYRLFGDGVRAA